MTLYVGLRHHVSGVCWCLRQKIALGKGERKKRHAKNETHLWHNPASIDTSPFSRLEDVTIPFLIRKFIGRAAPLNTSCF